MVREYLSNLLFRNSSLPAIDSENRGIEFSLYENNQKVSNWGNGLDFSQSTFLGEIDDVHSCLTASAPYSYIKYNKSIKSNTDAMTIDVRYMIDGDQLYTAMTSLTPIVILKWDNGSLNVLDHYEDTDTICIGLTIGNKVFRGLIRYDSIGYGNAAQIVINISNSSILLSLNGERISSKPYTSGIPILSNLCVGNCDNSYTTIQIDELVITNSIETPTSFSNKPFHSLYPEMEDLDVVKHRKINTVSRQDKMSLDLDITRHSDYTTPKSYRVDRVRRYEYDRKREG
jgi:hypothetical protein